MKMILNIIFWLNALIPIVVLGFYLAKLIISEGKCWEKLKKIQKRQVKKNIIFMIWLIMALHFANCGHQRQIGGMKQEQKRQIVKLELMITRQEEQIEEQRPYVGEYWRLLKRENEIVQQEEEIAKILNEKKFWYFSWRRLEDIRNLLDVQEIAGIRIRKRSKNE